LSVNVNSRFIYLQGERLFYQEVGEGTHILLIHAGVADSRMWENQIERLGKFFHLVAPDLRGFGKSLIPNGPFSYYEDIDGLINELGLSSTWLIGVSFGSRVAIDFYLAHPEKVKGLILVSPVVSGFKPSKEIEFFEQKEEKFLEAGDIVGATELNLRMWVDGPYRSPGQVNTKVRSKIADMLLSTFNIPIPENTKLKELDEPAIDRLEEILIPTLVVVGELDLSAVVDHAKLLAEKIPHARIEVVPGTAHMLSMEKPEIFNELVQQFVEHSD